MKCYFITLLLAISSILYGQQKLPVIQATSTHVSIRDGGILDKNAWRLSPKARPDIYVADRTRKTKWVTFYTDRDSIHIKVKPGSIFDFIILLNGRDSCFTQVKSAIPPHSDLAGEYTKPDSIPFTLTAYNAISVIATVNDSANYTLHFDLGSSGFCCTREVLARRPAIGKAIKLQMGTIIWDHPSLRPTALTAHDMDGRFGWDLFEGRTVEINYDKNLLIIRPNLPRVKGYRRLKMDFIRSLICVKAGFDIAGQQQTGDFMFDTGSDQAVIVDSAWAKEHGFGVGSIVIKTKVLHDGNGGKYETRTVMGPAFQLGDVRLADVPTMILGSKNPVGLELNFVGNDLLKRFNMILDFRKDAVYIRPNQLFHSTFREEI
jgi:Aspartyl protease